ncbi:MAG: MATE family efflux transporter [Parvularculaceae bacterium]
MQIPEPQGRLTMNWKTLPYRDVFRLAWPASVAASVTPLLGAVDVWALGRSERPLDIAAVGLGAVIFSLVYWTFGFIRMSVAGLTAQAAGADREDEARAALVRGAGLGAAIGFLLVLLQAPLGAIAFNLLEIGSDASDTTFNAAHDYFSIRIWGAPFALSTYALFGWLSARGRTDFLMIASLVMTGLNIALDWHFVVNLQQGAAGVALGTLIAEIAGFVIAALFASVIMTEQGGLGAHWRMDELFKPTLIRRTLSVNRDIFIRTLLLAAAYAWFVQRGGAFGDVTLAANQTLIQLFLFTGLALDGTAIAAETMVGRAVGRRDRKDGYRQYAEAVRATFIIALAGAALFSLFYLVAGDTLLRLLSPDISIRSEAARYMPWIIISPLIVVLGFQLDGVFIGATRAREMRNGMILSAIAFAPLIIYLARWYGNHGLWAAFSIYFLLRALTLGVYMPRIRRSFFDAPA